MIIVVSHKILKRYCFISVDDNAFLQKISNFFKNFDCQYYNKEHVCDIYIHKSGKKYNVTTVEGNKEGSEIQTLGYVSRLVIDNLGQDNNEYFILHSGAVYHNNNGYAFLGKTKSGKSTLIYTLCKKAGFSYLTDDLVCIDSHANVSSFPKPIFLRNLSHVDDDDKNSMELVEYEFENRYCWIPNNYEEIENVIPMKKIFLVNREDGADFIARKQSYSEAFITIWINMFSSTQLFEKRKLALTLAKKIEVYEVTFSEINYDLCNFLNLME